MTRVALDVKEVYKRMTKNKEEEKKRKKFELITSKARSLAPLDSISFDVLS